MHTVGEYRVSGCLDHGYECMHAAPLLQQPALQDVVVLRPGIGNSMVRIWPYEDNIQSPGVDTITGKVGKGYVVTYKST